MFIDSIPDQYRTQEICDIIIMLYPFLIVHCPNEYTSQKMCDEAVDDSLASLKLIADWFVKNKTIKTLFATLYAN